MSEVVPTPPETEEVENTTGTETTEEVTTTEETPTPEKKPQTILHKRGPEANLPELLESEIAFTTDEHNVYIGSNEGNVRLAKASELEALETPEGAQAKADAAESNAKSYTDGVIDDLIGTAPEDLDRIYELADAIQALRQQDYEALQAALSGKSDVGHGHTAGEITESDTKRFVSTAQINQWNGTVTGLAALKEQVNALEGITVIDGGTF